MTDKPTSFHFTKYGSFGYCFPTDSLGFVYLTEAGWIEAGYSSVEATELCLKAIHAKDVVDFRLSQWQDR